MNLLFFLTPTATCCYLYADYTLRQAMERMEHSGYSALPILTREGTYCGTLTEGDLLWATKKLCCMDFRDTEEHSIMRSPTGATICRSPSPRICRTCS